MDAPMGKCGCASGLRMSRCGTFSSSATSSSLPSCPQLSSSIPRLASIRKINWGHVPFFSIFTASRFSSYRSDSESVVGCARSLPPAHITRFGHESHENTEGNLSFVTAIPLLQAQTYGRLRPVLPTFATSALPVLPPFPLWPYPVHRKKPFLSNSLHHPAQLSRTHAAETLPHVPNQPVQFTRSMRQEHTFIQSIVEKEAVVSHVSFSTSPSPSPISLLFSSLCCFPSIRQV